MVTSESGVAAAGSAETSASIIGRFPDLQGKRALVTGGSAGIGRAIAIGLAENGVTVTVMARRRERLDAVLSQLKTKGYAVVGDICKVEDCTRTAEEAISLMGGLDILINNGAPNTPDMMQHKPAGFEAAIRMHVSSVVAFVKAADTELVKHNGCVVNISSMAALHVAALPIVQPYCVAKAAQDHLTRCLARQYAPLGVRVNATNPFWTKTEVIGQMCAMLQKSEEEVIAAAAKTVPMNRVSSAEEQAALVVFLCSRGAGFITGATIKADGGMTLMPDGTPRFDDVDLSTFELPSPPGSLKT